jgi:protocatechuate 3,4-dioxygenase beta subunit
MNENTTPDPTEDTGERLTRRRTLTRLGGFVAASFGAAGLEASLSRPAEGAQTGPAAVAAGLVSCVLTPEQTEGPYYIDTEKVRRDIREGRPGIAMLLRTTVVDASTCRPIKGAAVDVWHCDAGGTYSGVNGNTGTFLRGIQRTDAKGLATFVTLFPGWYPGRTTHIHAKVHLGGNVVHTGQLYFPESAVTAASKVRPYRLRGEPDTRNAADAIFRNGGSKALARMSRDASGRLVASLTMGVQRR